MSSKSEQVLDKQQTPIEVGDVVATKFRGGKRTGAVEEVVTIEREGIKYPPKALFTDQHGHHVQHNPETLVHGEQPK